MTLNHVSPMSITQLINSSNDKDDIITTNDIQDPDVKIAAEVLGDMARLSSVKGKKKKKKERLISIQTLLTNTIVHSN